jgi:hypothetical protein
MPGIVASLGPRGRGRPRKVEQAERVLFALVANRALAPSSTLAAADWITHDVHIEGLDEVDDACYRAMDWPHQIREKLENWDAHPARPTCCARPWTTARTGSHPSRSMLCCTGSASR